MREIKFTVLGIPQAKQSAKFRGVKMGAKTYIKSYQPEKVVNNERNIAFDIKSQLPLGFVPFDVALGTRVTFVFPPLSSWNKATKKRFEDGEKIYKITKPDLQDNLMKGLFDAINGIVLTDDARVAKVESEKIYGLVPRTELEIYILEN